MKITVTKPSDGDGIHIVNVTTSDGITVFAQINTDTEKLDEWLESTVEYMSDIDTDCKSIQYYDDMFDMSGDDNIVYSLKHNPRFRIRGPELPSGSNIKPWICHLSLLDE